MKSLIRPSLTTAGVLAVTVLTVAFFGTRLTMVLAQPPAEKPLPAAVPAEIRPETTPVPAPAATPPGGSAQPSGTTLGGSEVGPANSHPVANSPVTASPPGPLTTPPPNSVPSALGPGPTAPLSGIIRTPTPNYPVPMSSPWPQGAYGAGNQGGFPGGFQPAGMPPSGQSQADLEFEMKSQQFVAKLKNQTDEIQRKVTMDEIAALVTNHFNVRQKLRDQELMQMQDQLQKLRLLQERREASRAQIIADRVRQLVRESEGLNWGGPQVNPQSQPHRSLGSGFTVNPGVVPRHLQEQAQKALNGAADLTANPGGAKQPQGSGTKLYDNQPQGIPAEELKIFAISGLDDAAELVKVIEPLLSNGTQRAQVVVIAYGNKIIAKGRAEGLSLVESIINKLQDDLKARPK